MVRVQVTAGTVAQALPCCSQSPDGSSHSRSLESEQDRGR